MQAGNQLALISKTVLPSRASRSCVVLRLSCLEVAGESKSGSREMGISWSRGLHEFISITLQRFQPLSFHYLTHHSLRLS
jgi:hypothetical protein